MKLGRKFATAVLVIVVLVVVFIVSGPFYILNEGEQSVVIRFGQLVNSQVQAGLKFRTPFTDQVIKYPKKILSWDDEPSRVPTIENQFIWIDTTARWKISDIKVFYSKIQTMEKAYGRLTDLIESSVRSVVSRNSLSEAVRNSNNINNNSVSGQLETSGVPQEDLQKYAPNLIEENRNLNDIEKGRSKLSDEILTLAKPDLKDLGIELIDVVIRKIKYSDELTNTVYERMISERQKVAKGILSIGEGKKEEKLGQIEKEKITILSEAKKEAEIIKGDGDKEAAKIYNNAYSQDSEFYKFWKALSSYLVTLKDAKKVITTDVDYFKYLKESQ